MSGDEWRREYRVVWRCQLERADLITGTLILGEQLPAGRGDSPRAAYEALAAAVTELQSDQTRMEDALGEAP